MKKDEIWQKLKNDKSMVYNEPILNVFLKITDDLKKDHYNELSDDLKKLPNIKIRMKYAKDENEFMYFLKTSDLSDVDLSKLLSSALENGYFNSLKYMAKERRGAFRLGNYYGFLNSFAKIAQKNPAVWKDFRYVSDQILDMYRKYTPSQFRIVINDVATIAIRYDNMDLFQDMLSRGADDAETFIYMAASKGNISLLKDTMQLKNITELAVHSAFTIACEKGRLEIVKYLIDKIKKPNWDIIAQGFYLACQEDKLEIVRYLIEKYGTEKFNIEYAIDYQSPFWGKVRQYLKSLVS